MNVWVTLGISALTTLGIAAAVLLIIWLFIRVLGRKVDWLIPAYEQIRPRLRIFVLTLALLVTTTAIDPLDALWWSVVTRGISLLSILAGGFLIQSVVDFTVGRFITTFEQGDQNNVEIRRIETQLRIIKRLANAIIGVLMGNAEKARALVKGVTPSLSGRTATCSSGCQTALEFAIITQPDARDPKMVEKLSAVAGRVLGK